MSKKEYKNLEEVREMIEACYRCGDCRIAYRPAVGRYLVCPVRENIPGKWEPYFARGKIMLANGLLKNEIKPSQELADIVFQCMTCGSCQTICNQSYHPSLKHPLAQIMDHPRIWEALRAELVERGFSIQRHSEILEYCKEHHNPYFEKHKDRTQWIPTEKTYPDEAEYLLFMGCTEPYRIPEILQKTIKILDAANVDYTISNDEWCCGSVALRTGDRSLAEDLAKHNLEVFKKSKAKKIITHCAGCYRTLKIDYKELFPDFDFKVIHITELIQELIEKGKLELKKDIDKVVTYHDPCHLGRHVGIYEAPRDVINNIHGLTFKEMKRIKENSWCCGAGGGVKSSNPNLAVEIAVDRIEEALETEADCLVTACPFCIRNLKDAYGKLKTEKLEVLDILDLVIESMEIE
ncbi:MAG: (Fe-S)-binding protein [Candidatus Lokiarchaeota archaeon]|nr:(Fe-S)-binding protein [Candidatus Lokiarchaeota archaeon]